MSLYVVDDIFGYQDANEMKTMQFGTSAPASPGTGELWMNTSSALFVVQRFNGASWNEITIPTDGTNFKNLSDTGKLMFGESDDLQLYHDGSNSYIDNNTGILILYNYAVGQDIRIQAKDNSGDVGVAYFDPDYGGASANLSLRLKYDNSYLTLGAGDDLQLYHDGTDSKIINSNGKIQIENYSHGKDLEFRFEDNNGNAGWLYFDPDFGNDTSANLSLRMAHDNSKLTLGASNDLQLYHDGTDSYIKNLTGDLILDIANDVLIKADSKKLSIGAGEDLQFYHNGTDSYITNNTGTLRIGSAGAISIIGSGVLTLGDFNYSVSIDGFGVDIEAYANTDIGLTVSGAGNLNISGLPTGSAGLATGDIWLNSNVLTIVP